MNTNTNHHSEKQPQSFPIDPGDDLFETRSLMNVCQRCQCRKSPHHGSQRPMHYFLKRKESIRGSKTQIKEQIELIYEDDEPVNTNEDNGSDENLPANCISQLDDFDR